MSKSQGSAKFRRKVRCQQYNPAKFDASKKANSKVHPVQLEFHSMGLPLNMDVNAAEGMHDKMECLPSSPLSSASLPSCCASLGLLHQKQNSETVNMDDDVFDAIVHISEQNLQADFAALEKRTLSTSTPTLTRTVSTSAITTQAASDSGFNESTWSTAFAESCSISHDENASFDEPPAIIYKDVDDVSLDPLMSMPMPQMFLKFFDSDDPMEDQSHADSAFGDCSSVASQSHSHHSDSCFSELCHSLEAIPESLELDDLAPLPSPSIIGAHELTTPAQSSKVYSSTPLQGSVSAIVDMIVKEFSPSVPSRMIGRNMGLETMDVVSELSFLDLSEPLSLIMSHLEDEDICRMCSVSREWNSVCKTNLVAQQKKQNLFDEKQAMLEEYQQENMSLKGTKKKVTGNSEAPLAVVQDLVEERVVSSTPLPLPTNHQQFVQEASRLKCDESLRKCPSCCKPARVHEGQERGQCTNRKCGLDFCIKCNSNFHGSRDCSVVCKKSRMDSTVGTKKSKKNLRRL